MLALHDREAEALWVELERVLADRDRTPRERLLAAVGATFAAQHHAHPLQQALHQEDVSVPQAPGFTDFEAHVIAGVARFLEEAAPQREGEHSTLARHVFFVLTSLRDRVAREPLDDDALRDLASHTGVMLAEFLGL